MTAITLDYNPHPGPQYDFHASQADEVLYGGAAGGGKSRALRMEAAKICLLYSGMHALILRRTYPELEMEIIRKFLEEIPRQLGRYNDSKKRFTFTNGSVLQFGYAESDADVLRYQGAEFGWIGIDELTHFNEYQYTYLLSRLRTTDPAVWPRVRATSNPGGVGHGWVKSRFITPAPACALWQPDPGRSWTRCFIPARLSDNPSLTLGDPHYRERLEQLPETERRALLEGDWDVFAGGVFTEWRRSIHVEEPWELPPGTKYFTSGDRGMAAASCILRWAILPDGQLRVIGEEYGTGWITSELGRRWLAMGVGDYGVSDPAMWARQGHSGEAEAEVLMRMGIQLRQADNDRIQGKARVHEWLKPVPGLDGSPSALLKIWSPCINLIQEIPQLVYSRTKIEDIDDNSGIHHADAYSALRYGLMSRPSPSTARGFVPGTLPGSRRRGRDDDEDRDQDERRRPSFYGR